MGSSTPLTVTVFNGVNTAASNIGMHYQINGGTVVNETLSSLAGKASASYTFSQTINTSAPGTYAVKVWASFPGDDSHSNDTLYYTFHHEPLISAFPYLENFENNDGYWWGEGQINTWAWGTPASPKIDRAASGTKAWKTNLTGYYSSGEHSYLYSPCFDISSLSNPMLSFAVNMQIENCGSTSCDGAWMEYSIGGGTWTKLGTSGQGTNWYNDSTKQLWNLDSAVRWRVASIPLPAASQPIRFRFVLTADAGTEYDGLAVDAVHLYDLSSPLYTSGAAGPVSNAVSGAGYTDFSTSGALLAQISAGNSSSLGTTSVQAYAHTNLIAPSGQQYFLPRSFVIHTQNTPSDSITARLYVSDSDVIKLVHATGCSGCSRPDDVFQLGITKYDDANTANENGSLTDNTGGSYGFIPAARVLWVPYDQGYYAEVKLASFSELWFNNGGAAGSFPLPVTGVDFDAHKSGERDVVLSWKCLVDTQVGYYELQRSANARDWTTVAQVPPVHDNAHRYSYTDRPGGAPAYYYRLKFTLLNGRDYYSELRQVIWGGGRSAVSVYPNPVRDHMLRMDWNTQPGAAMTAQLTDMAGRLIREWAGVADDYSNTSVLDISGVQSGVYFLRVDIGGEEFNVKVVRW